MHLSLYLFHAQNIFSWVCEIKDFPPDTQGQETADKIMGIIYHSMPITWENEMIEQGFNYADSIVKEINDFFEFRVENMEPKDEKKIVSNCQETIIRKDVLYERPLKDKKIKWLTMAVTFNTTFVTEIILKLSELNHSADVYAKCHLTNKLLNYDLILGRDILHKLGIIFNFENKTITCQEV